MIKLTDILMENIYRYRFTMKMEFLGFFLQNALRTSRQKVTIVGYYLTIFLFYAVKFMLYVLLLELILPHGKIIFLF